MPKVTQQDIIQLLSRHVLPSGFDQAGILKGIGDDQSLGHAYSRALIRGLSRADFKLAPWTELTNKELPFDWTVAFGRLWESLESAGFLSSFVLNPELLCQTRLRLWAYLPAWHLCYQDEDLVLMDTDNEYLLSLASEPACPKRAHILSAVLYDLKYKIRWQIQKSNFGKYLQEILQHREIAEKANASEIVNYLNKIAYYFSAVREVNLDEAYQMQFDLSGFNRAEPQRSSKDNVWKIPIKGGPKRFHSLLVDCDTGHIKGVVNSTGKMRVEFSSLLLKDLCVR